MRYSSLNFTTTPANGKSKQNSQQSRFDENYPWGGS